MKTISTVGLDLAKSVFQVHAVDPQGVVVMKRKLRRADVPGFFAALPPCVVGMEACGTAHHWARQIVGMGHAVRLVPTQYVEPFVKRGKTDAADAEAIAIAASQPSIRPVAIKTIEQQCLLVPHRVREILMTQRTQTINAIRSHLSELGIIAPTGEAGVRALIAVVGNADDARVPAAIRVSLKVFVMQLDGIAQGLAVVESEIEKAHEADALSQRLDTIPGIAALTATAFSASIGDATRFKSGRSFSAWLGLTPKITGSGGKVVLGEITRAGDKYLRRLLYTGALSVVLLAKRKPKDHPWLAKLLVKMKFKQVVIAQANKMARIIWALMVRGGIYEPGHQAAVRGARAAGKERGSAMTEFVARPA
jgi:transposase